ncbi:MULTISPECIES: DUF3106 domain-containing protein [unclassified Luteimonas]|uniref:DUF3106 domain-containing protein n=1 Tax=unclassified Luteimonas TaxID=2629088 RepID=UPI0018F05D43|nr:MULTISPECIES: DUF3106 domain-containing protein [unclassified Luteimonas]MBJ6981247.1 DUF3106 domain-containing protein [Luteimonas sp. MC1572]MBJ7576173.1 DUF3106 domain-containing protein [Luteimonas sp. MC1828]QQO02571.1 DUF3106 domain-containing protein [Luteimonas sp. MC1572]
MHIRLLATLLLPLALALSLPAAAQGPAKSEPLPTWDQLDSEQREALVAPLKQRWDDRPEGRAKMLAHARRWQQMTPEQRERARHGADRWHGMSPAEKAETRALYGKLRSLPEDERRALRARWKAMTPEQRRAWAEANPPAERGAAPPR